METKDKFVITINRQFGTGGHVIGEQLAKRLNVRFVDKEILSSAAKLLEIDKNVAEKLSNKKPSWWDDFVNFCSTTSNNISIENKYDQIEPTTRQLFYAQAKIIKEIAEMESCVIIGRCAFDILKNMPNTLKVFLHSPDDIRIKRITDIRNIPKEKAKDTIKEIDTVRESYTKAYTNKYWWDARNYDFTIDVSKIGIEKTVDKIIEMAPYFINI
jgi:cytidylate kinase